MVGRLFFVRVEDASERTLEILRRRKPYGILLSPEVLSKPEELYRLLHLVDDMGGALMVTDHEGGQLETIPYIPPSPGNLAFGSVGDPKIVERYAEVSGRIMKALGLNMVFAPVLDLKHGDSGGVMDLRVFGEDPEVVSELGIAAIDGYERAGIMACAKHFPGHGRTSVDSHEELPVVSADVEEIERTDLVPFERAVYRGVGAVMLAHVVYSSFDERPASISEVFIREILRESWGYDGLIISDSVDMKALWKNYSTGEQIRRFYGSGGDSMIVPMRLYEEYAERLENHVKGGIVPRSLVEDSAERFERALERYPSTGGFGFFMDLLEKHVTFKNIERSVGESPKVLLPRPKNLSPADTTESFYHGIKELALKHFPNAEIVEYDLDEPEDVDVSGDVIDIVVDSYRSEKLLNFHRSIGGNVVYIIARDPYDERFYSDRPLVVTRSLTPYVFDFVFEKLKNL